MQVLLKLNKLHEKEYVNVNLTLVGESFYIIFYIFRASNFYSYGNFKILKYQVRNPQKGIFNKNMIWLLQRFLQIFSDVLQKQFFHLDPRNVIEVSIDQGKKEGGLLVSSRALRSVIIVSL